LRHKRAPGFSLVELLIVLAILSLAVAIAFPALSSRGQGAALASATQQLRAALAAARSAAIAEDRDVIFSGDGALYSVDGAAQALPVAGVAIARTRIAFFPSGGSSGGRIVLRTAAAEREIDIEPLTGRAIPVR